MKKSFSLVLAGTMITSIILSQDPVTTVSTGQDAVAIMPAGNRENTAQSVPVEALNYVAPMTELIRFNENEFLSLETVITGWDKQLKRYVAEIEKVKGQMLYMENELRKMKNADNKPFTSEIKSLKDKLNAYRNKYWQSKEMLIGEGQSIVRQLEDLKSDRIRAVGKAYADASQLVGSANTNPSGGETPVIVSYTLRPVNDETVSYIVFTTEALTWYQNDIRSINAAINDWNSRIRNIIKEDTGLINQLEPTQRKLEELMVNRKENRDEISSLKKQATEIEKARKELADRMKQDSKELVAYLKLTSQKNQDSIKERFTDIIENTTYSFTEKLGL